MYDVASYTAVKRINAYCADLSVLKNEFRNDMGNNHVFTYTINIYICMSSINRSSADL
jgi:hypothetical protein